MSAASPVASSSRVCGLRIPWAQVSSLAIEWTEPREQGAFMAVIRRGGCEVVLALMVAGCSPHTVSGAYVAQGPQFVELLQITQSPDGQLLGTLNHFDIKPDGSSERFTLNISGNTDGHALTLIGKANEAFAVPTNMSGTAEHGVITVTQPNGIERFALSSPEAYQTAIQRLGEEGNAIQQANAQQQQLDQEKQQEIAAENAKQAAINNANQRVQDLANALNKYASMVQEHHDLSPFHNGHDKVMTAARHDLNIQKNYPKGSVQASQVAVRISQLSVQLTQFDIPWGQYLDRGHTHIGQFDAAISASPCHAGQEQLSACVQELDAEKNYQAAKSIVLREMDDVGSTIKQDTDEMNQIDHEASAY